MNRISAGPLSVGIKRWARGVRSATGPAQPPMAVPSQGLRLDLGRLFPDGATNVFDVGAYAGEFAALVHDVFPNARVWCFEPFPASYDRIRTRFSGADWVHVRNLGLSDRSGTADLIVGD